MAKAKCEMVVNLELSAREAQVLLAFLQCVNDVEGDFIVELDNMYEALCAAGVDADNIQVEYQPNTCGIFREVK